MKRFRYTTRYGFVAACGVIVAMMVTSCSQSHQQGSQHNAASTPALSRQTFAAFRGALPSDTTNLQCSLDIINGRLAGYAGPLIHGSTVTFGGWVGNGYGQAANGVLLVMKDAVRSYSVPLTTNVARPDVAKALGSPGMAKSGFNVAAPLAGVTSGTYSLYVVDPANPNANCDLHRALTVQ